MDCASKTCPTVHTLASILQFYPFFRVYLKIAGDSLNSQPIVLGFLDIPSITLINRKQFFSL